MVLASTFLITLPAFTTPPPMPIPGGFATPTALTSVLKPLFDSGVAGGSMASAQIASALANYLAGWAINVTVPPAAASPIPII